MQNQHKIVILKAFCYLLLTGFCTFSRGSMGSELTPQSVWTSAETAKDHPVSLMIDGSLKTYSQIFDDSRTGKKKDVLPPFGSTPVTATIVFDLGDKKEIQGIRITAQPSWLPRLPQNVSFFTCDDPQGKINRSHLTEGKEILPFSSSCSAFVSWPNVKTRFIGMRINDSWEKDFSPGFDSTAIQYCLEESDYAFKAFPNSGWWMGIWKHLLTKEGLESPGFGTKFLFDIAEVSFYNIEPEDFVRPNPANVAFPKDRLYRDWMNQDHGVDITDCFVSKANNTVEKTMVQKVFDELAAEELVSKDLLKRQAELEKIPGADPRWKQLYLDACQKRRDHRLAFLREETRQIVYSKHYILGGWTGGAGSEQLSDGAYDIRNPDYRPGSELCLITFKEDGSLLHEVLISAKDGLIRDPCFSDDAKRLIFSMRSSFRSDDYHLYLMDMETRETKQITFSPVVDGKIIPCSDTDPVFAPDGKIVFCSTRNTNQDVCWLFASANLFTCNADGSEIRRLGFDQLHSFSPAILNDGRVLYTRWEYNDRNHSFMQSLFTMNPNGTAQTEYYGNNSWYPCGIYFAKAIPDSNKVLGIVSGHHTHTKGKLALIDTTRGTQGDDGIEFVAGASPDGKPGRQPSQVMKGKKWEYSDRDPIDYFGQTGSQFLHPFAFDESHYLCSMIPEGSAFQKGPYSIPFGIYYIDDEGNRELLAFDWSISSCHPTARIERTPPISREGSLDLSQSFGKYYVDDIYFGPGLKDVTRGTIKKIRVVAQEYRVARIGTSDYSNRGIGGDTPVQTPIATPNGSYDVKHVLGEVHVEEDGSALFEVPACTPVYFQMLDDQGRCVQTMRSWSTLMPGEFFSCFGCHEDKRETTLNSSRIKMAMTKPPQKLQAHLGVAHPLINRLQKGNRFSSLENWMNVNQLRSRDTNAPVEGFSFRSRVQPILDKHCVECHQGNEKGSEMKNRSSFDLSAKVVPGPVSERAFYQSYLSLIREGEKISCPDEVDAFQKKNGRLPLVCWYHAQGPAEMIPPRSAGSSKSRLMQYLEPSHYQVQLSDQEKQTIACWIDLSVPFCGSYAEANLWTEKNKKKFDYYSNKRRVFAEMERNSFLPQK